MPAIPVKGRAAALQAPQDCEDCVSQRQSRGQQRKNQRGDGRGVCAPGRDEIHAEERDAEAQRGAAGIAHENSRGREIEDQKGGAGAEQAPGQRAADRAERGAGDKEVSGGDYRGDSCGEAVCTIEKIKGEDARGDVAGFARTRAGD